MGLTYETVQVKWALVQFCTEPKPDGIKHTVAHTIVLCMHQQRFIPPVIGPVRNCTSAVKCTTMDNNCTEIGAADLHVM